MEIETHRALRSYEAIPWTPNKCIVEGEVEKIGGERLAAAAYGRWTMRMMSSLRQMCVEAVESGDRVLQEQIERAYYYLYTRETGKRKVTRGRSVQTRRN